MLVISLVICLATAELVIPLESVAIDVATDTFLDNTRNVSTI